MAIIIQFHNDNKITDNYKPKKNNKFFKKCAKVITFIATFCTISGITVDRGITLYFSRHELPISIHNVAVDQVVALLERDWQKEAEQYNNVGLELYDLGKYEEAVESYDKAIDLEDKGIEDIEVCYYNRGRAYFKLGNYEKAIEDYSNAINISPKSKYYSDRAVTYEKIGNSENAALDNAKASAMMIEELFNY